MGSLSSVFKKNTKADFFSILPDVNPVFSKILNVDIFLYSDMSTMNNTAE